jgi:hypothetical protein
MPKIKGKINVVRKIFFILILYAQNSVIVPFKLLDRFFCEALSFD